MLLFINAIIAEQLVIVKMTLNHDVKNLFSPHPERVEGRGVEGHRSFGRAFKPSD
jgi:hypothetical protein